MTVQGNNRRQHPLAAPVRPVLPSQQHRQQQQHVPQAGKAAAAAARPRHVGPDDKAPVLHGKPGGGTLEPGPQQRCSSAPALRPALRNPGAHRAVGSQRRSHPLSPRPSPTPGQEAGLAVKGKGVHNGGAAAASKLSPYVMNSPYAAASAHRSRSAHPLRARARPAAADAAPVPTNLAPVPAAIGQQHRHAPAAAAPAPAVGARARASPRWGAVAPVLGPGHPRQPHEARAAHPHRLSSPEPQHYHSRLHAIIAAGPRQAKGAAPAAAAGARPPAAGAAAGSQGHRASENGRVQPQPVQQPAAKAKAAAAVPPHPALSHPQQAQLQQHASPDAALPLDDAAGHGHEAPNPDDQWAWFFRSVQEPESPYGSEVLRALMASISPRFEKRRPYDYIPHTPSSLGGTSRYARSDIWSPAGELSQAAHGGAVYGSPSPDGLRTRLLVLRAAAAAASADPRTPSSAGRGSSSAPTSPRHSGGGAPCVPRLTRSPSSGDSREHAHAAALPVRASRRVHAHAHSGYAHSPCSPSRYQRIPSMSNAPPDAICWGSRRRADAATAAVPDTPREREPVSVPMPEPGQPQQVSPHPHHAGDHAAEPQLASPPPPAHVYGRPAVGMSRFQRQAMMQCTEGAHLPPIVSAPPGPGAAISSDSSHRPPGGLMWEPPPPPITITLHRSTSSFTSRPGSSGIATPDCPTPRSVDLATLNAAQLRRALSKAAAAVAGSGSGQAGMALPPHRQSVATVVSECSEHLTGQLARRRHSDSGSHSTPRTRCKQHRQQHQRPGTSVAAPSASGGSILDTSRLPAAVAGKQCLQPHGGGSSNTPSPGRRAVSAHVRSPSRAPPPNLCAAPPPLPQPSVAKRRAVWELPCGPSAAPPAPARHSSPSRGPSGGRPDSAAHAQQLFAAGPSAPRSTSADGPSPSRAHTPTKLTGMYGNNSPGAKSNFSFHLRPSTAASEVSTARMPVAPQQGDRPPGAPPPRRRWFQSMDGAPHPPHLGACTTVQEEQGQQQRAVTPVAQRGAGVGAVGSNSNSPLKEWVEAQALAVAQALQQQQPQEGAGAGAAAAPSQAPGEHVAAPAELITPRDDSSACKAEGVAVSSGSSASTWGTTALHPPGAAAAQRRSDDSSSNPSPTPGAPQATAAPPAAPQPLPAGGRSSRPASAAGGGSGRPGSWRSPIPRIVACTSPSRAVLQRANSHNSRLDAQLQEHLRPGTSPSPLSSSSAKRRGSQQRQPAPRPASATAATAAAAVRHGSASASASGSLPRPRAGATQRNAAPSPVSHAAAAAHHGPQVEPGIRRNLLHSFSSAGAKPPRASKGSSSSSSAQKDRQPEGAAGAAGAPHSPDTTQQADQDQDASLDGVLLLPQPPTEARSGRESAPQRRASQVVERKTTSGLPEPPPSANPAPRASTAGEPPRQQSTPREGGRDRDREMRASAASEHHHRHWSYDRNRQRAKVLHHVLVVAASSESAVRG